MRTDSLIFRKSPHVVGVEFAVTNIVGFAPKIRVTCEGIYLEGEWPVMGPGAVADLIRTLNVAEQEVTRLKDKP